MSVLAFTHDGHNRTFFHSTNRHGSPNNKRERKSAVLSKVGVGGHLYVVHAIRATRTVLLRGWLYVRQMKIHQRVLRSILNNNHIVSTMLPLQVQRHLLPLLLR